MNDEQSFIQSILNGATNGHIATPKASEKVNRKKRKLIKELRKKQGMTLVELSNLSNISVAYLSRIENGYHKLNEKMLNRISRALGCSPSDLLGKENILHIDGHDIINVPIYSMNIITADSAPEIWKCKIDFSNKNNSISIPKILSNDTDLIAIKINFSDLSPTYLSGEILILSQQLPEIKGRPILIMNNETKNTIIGDFDGFDQNEIAIKNEFHKSQDGVKLRIENTKDISTYSIIGRLECQQQPKPTSF